MPAFLVVLGGVSVLADEPIEALVFVAAIPRGSLALPAQRRLALACALEVLLREHRFVAPHHAGRSWELGADVLAELAVFAGKRLVV